MIPFLLLSSIYFLNVLGRMLFPMLAPQFAEQYLLTPSTVGTLCFVLASGFGLSLFLSQFLSAKIGLQKAISLSAISSGALLLLFPFIDHLSVLITFLFILGLCTGLFLPSAIAYLGLLVPPAKLGRTIGSFSSFQTAAMISVPLVGGWAAGFASFRPLFSLVGFSLLLVGLLFEYFATERMQKGQFPSLAYFKEALLSKSNQAMFGFHSLAVGLNIGIFTIAPAYFIGELNLSEGALFPMLSLSRALGILATLLGGFLIDVWGFRPSLTASLFLNGLFTLLLGLLPSEYAIFNLCLQGPLAVALTTMVYVGISKTAPEGRRASLISLFASSSFLMGAGVIPQALGILGDWNLFSMGFALLGAASLFLGALYSRRDLLVQKT